MKDKPLQSSFLKATLLLGSTMTVMAGSTIAPTLPLMKVTFFEVPHVDFLVRILLTVHALFIALSAPMAGIFLDRLGRKPVLIFSVVLFGLAGSSGFALNSLYMILIGRAILGIAVAGTTSGFTTLIGDYFEGESLNKYMGLQAAFVGFGGVVFLSLGGFLADIGWRYPFLIYLFGFVVLPGVQFCLYEPQIKQSDKNESKIEKKIPFPLLTGITIFTVTFLGWLFFYMVPVQLPFYLKALEDVSSTQIGMAIGTMVLFGAFSSIMYRKMKGWFSFQKIFAFFFLLMGFGYLIIAMAGSYRQALLGLAISGLGNGLLMPNANVWLVSLVPPDLRGRAMGGLTTCVLLGQFFSPILAQPVIRLIDMGGNYALSGGIMLALAVLFLCLRSDNGGQET